MAVFNQPTQWGHELGNNADVSTLPDDTGATTGVASLQKLFQVINQTPLEAGGIAPSRIDFNALFKILGDSIFYMQNGGFWAYNSAFDYAVGRVVLYNGNLYKCIQANGASSTVVAPDSVSPLGSDYWVQVATLLDFANYAETDFSNVTAPVQAFKDMSIGWLEPDYSALYSTTSNNFVLPKTSYLYALGMISPGGSFVIRANDQEICGATSTNTLENLSVYTSVVFCPAGTTITIPFGTVTYVRIVPCKGAN